jgi:hypothetical protein
MPYGRVVTSVAARAFDPAQNHGVASITSPKRIQLLPFHRAS